MAGSCCGSVRVMPRLDPAACNALTQSPAGLLVPRTALQGIAPGGSVGATLRRHRRDGARRRACPETWTVGGRLTPVSGQTSGAVGIQGSPFDTWIPVTGAQLVLPEAGVYEVIADVQGGVIMNGSVSNAIIQARLFDVTAGAVVLSTVRTILLFAATPSTSVHTLKPQPRPRRCTRWQGPE